MKTKNKLDTIERQLAYLSSGEWEFYRYNIFTEKIENTINELKKIIEEKIAKTDTEQIIRAIYLWNEYTMIREKYF